MVRLELRHIYQHTVTPGRARHRLESWLGSVRGKCESFGEVLDPLAKVADTIEKHLDSILTHWTRGWLSTAFIEELNSVFNSVKRKTGGYGSRDYMIAI